MIDREIIISERIEDLIRLQAKQRPDQTALICDGRETTYAQMNTRANRVANAFLKLGVGPGDRVVWLARNVPQFWDTLLGAIKIGAVLTPVNWRLAPREIAQIVDDAGAKLFIGEADFIEALESIDGFKLPNGMLLEGDGEDGFDSIVDSADEEEPTYRSTPDDVVVQLYTSGTTGLPKGVLLTQSCYSASAVAGAEMELVKPRYEDEAALHALPHFHVAGVNYGLMAIARSMPIIQHRDFNPAAIVDEAQKGRPLNSFFVPAMIMMILQAAKEKGASLDAFSTISYGAAPMPEPLLDAAMDAMPNAKWTQFYGATETTGGLTCLRHEDHAKGLKQRVSAGRPYPGSETRIVDPASGKEVGDGETGEIHTKSKFLMQGYWNRQDATEEVLQAGWYATGDAGYRDENGFIYVVDRIKDMIISGGENIYPAELENALGEHPAIAEAAVIGVPDEKWGEVVKVCAVCRPDEGLDEDGLKAFLADRVARFKLPRFVEFMPALPRNPSGKILKTELRKAHSG